MIQTLLSRKYDSFDGFGTLILDECFPRRQQILTSNGNMEIGRIYDAWKRGEDIFVKSYDEHTSTFSFKKVTHAWEKTADALLRVGYSKSNLKCTPNHKILTTSGWKQARDLVVGDLLVSSYNDDLAESASARALNSDQYQIMLGSILGDGCLMKSPGGRYRIKFIQGEKQELYLQWKADMFGIDRIHTNRLGFTNSLKYTCSTFSIDLENDIDIAIRSSVPQWIIEDMDWRAIAVWYMDDGSLQKRSGCVSFSSCAFDLDTHERLQTKLQSLGVNTKIRLYKSYYQLDLGLDDSQYLLHMISPYLHDSMSYKLEIDRYSDIIFEGRFSYKWNNKFLDYGTIRVSSITPLVKKDKRVYDLEVADNHTFVCSSKGMYGPVVHNCHHVAAESFTSAMFYTSFKHVIGLSATPTRKDGLTRVLYWLFGDLAYEARRTNQQGVTVKLLPFTHQEYKTPPPLNRRGDICYSSLISKICDIHERTQFIAEKAKKLADMGKFVLVLSHRRQHATDICNELKSLGVDAATYLGGQKSEPDCQVICATYALASEGYDNPRLSGIVLATPSSDVVQAVGRVLRGGSGSNPVVVDIVDQYSLFLGQLAKRRAWYKKIGFKIHGAQEPEPKKIEEQLGAMFIDDED
jgi:hypothetical protein